MGFMLCATRVSLKYSWDCSSHCERKKKRFEIMGGKNRLFSRF